MLDMQMRGRSPIVVVRLWLQAAAEALRAANDPVVRGESKSARKRRRRRLAKELHLH